MIERKCDACEAESDWVCRKCYHHVVLVSGTYERQRDSLGGHVAERYGLKDSDDVRRIETSSDALVHMARIDKHVARVMQEWSL